MDERSYLDGMNFRNSGLYRVVAMAAQGVVLLHCLAEVSIYRVAKRLGFIT